MNGADRDSRRERLSVLRCIVRVERSLGHHAADSGPDDFEAIEDRVEEVEKRVVAVEARVEAIEPPA